jgi:hypothetical protein
VNDTTKKRRSVRVFFFLLAADNLVADPLRVFGPGESREPRPNPSNEGNDDDTQPGNTPARLSLQRSGFQGTWGRLGGAEHGLSRQKLVLVKTSSHWSYGNGWPERPQTYSKMSDEVSQPYQYTVCISKHSFFECRYVNILVNNQTQLQHRISRP